MDNFKDFILIYITNDFRVVFCLSDFSLKIFIIREPELTIKVKDPIVVDKMRTWVLIVSLIMFFLIREVTRMRDYNFFDKYLVKLNLLNFL
jgi:hypothetical protein